MPFDIYDLDSDPALLLYLFATRDEEVFVDPFEFRVDRRPKEHLSFGIGPHYCLGATLARMVIETVVGILLERLPDLRLAPGARIREGRNPILSTIEQMLVEFAPRSAD